MDNEKLYEVACDVADTLGPDWRVDKNRTKGIFAGITGSQGAGITLRIYKQGRQTRVKVWGLWPTDITGHIHYPYDNNPEITCALSRGGRAIAADIQQRFMPDYLPQFQRMLNSQQEADRARYRREALTEELAEILDSNIDTMGNLRIRGNRGAAHWVAEVTTYDKPEVRLDIRYLPFEKALRIGQILAEAD